MADQHKKIPVLLMTGFLGAGKTTLVNWFLENFPDKKMSVLLNEFGDIKLESQFITGDGLEVAEIANGCMCCAAKDDIPLAINYILDQAPATEYLLVEASGLSDPAPIRAVFAERFNSPEVDADLSQRVRLDANLCVVDAVNFFDSRQEYQIVNSQIGDADIVILNKTKLAGREQSMQVEKVIQAMLPQARIFWFDEGLPKQLLFEPAEFFQPKDEQTATYHQPDLDHHHEHTFNHVHQPYTEFWYTSDLVFDQLELEYALRALPKSVVRAKGVVWVKGPTDQPMPKLVTFVAGRVEMLPAPKQEKQQNGMVFLGQGFEEHLIKDILTQAEVEV